MEDKEIIEIFEKILKELNENIVNDEIDRSNILNNMNTILVYCNISEKFRKTYCNTESDIRKMANARIGWHELDANFSDAISNKREIEEVWNKYKPSFKPLILIYYFIFALVLCMTLVPETSWIHHGMFYTMRAIGLALLTISPLCVWRSLSEKYNAQEKNCIADFINHSKEWKWSMDHPYKVPGYVSIRIPTEVFFNDHDYKYNERMMKSIQTCMDYNALQNISFEKSEKYDIDDVTYIRIGLSKEACKFITGYTDEANESDDDTTSRLFDLLHVLKRTNVDLPELEVQEGVLRKE